MSQPILWQFFDDAHNHKNRHKLSCRSETPDFDFSHAKMKDLPTILGTFNLPTDSSTLRVFCFRGAHDLDLAREVYQDQVAVRKNFVQFLVASPANSSPVLREPATKGSICQLNNDDKVAIKATRNTTKGCRLLSLSRYIVVLHLPSA